MRGVQQQYLMQPASQRLEQDASRRRRRRLLSQQNSQTASSRTQLSAAERGPGGPAVQRSSVAVSESGHTAVEVVDRDTATAQVRRALRVRTSAAGAPLTGARLCPSHGEGSPDHVLCHAIHQARCQQVIGLPGLQAGGHQAMSRTTSFALDADGPAAPALLAGQRQLSSEHVQQAAPEGFEHCSRAARRGVRQHQRAVHIRHSGAEPHDRRAVAELHKGSRRVRRHHGRGEQDNQLRHADHRYTLARRPSRQLQILPLAQGEHRHSAMPG